MGSLESQHTKPQCNTGSAYGARQGALVSCHSSKAESTPEYRSFFDWGVRARLPHLLLASSF